MKNKAILAAFAAIVIGAYAGEPVKWRGIFINDEDWNLRPWAERCFGEAEGIGTNTYAIIYDMMKADGLNLIWPAMHEGGYEFSSRPENMAQAEAEGITVGTSHCEPMLRNNCYLKDKAKWDWLMHRDFVADYWRETAERYQTNNVLWTIGMRGIHDAGMTQGTNMAHKIEIMEDVFKTQCSLLPPDASKVFCPYKEVLPIYNAGLKIPEGTTILWVNDNYGYVRRLGGPQCDGYGQGIYWHVSYWGLPHSYLQLCTTSPAFMWYELVAKCANNGVRDLWMLNVGDVFQAEILIYCYGKFAADPDYWMTRPNPQSEVLAMWVDENLRVSAPLREKIVSHLNEYYNLGFIRKPEHMCAQWAARLPESVKVYLLARYHALLEEDLAIEKELASLHDSATLRETYFRAVGFQAQFLAHAGIIFLEGKDRDYARSVLDPLNRRFDEIEDGKWAGFWWDTIDDPAPPHRHKRFSYMHMMWPWNDENNTKNLWRRSPQWATAYSNAPDPEWLEPVANVAANGGAWTAVPGLGTSGKALALLPVKPGIGEGAVVEYCLAQRRRGAEAANLVIRFLPDFALWPGLGMKVGVKIGDAPEKIIEVPASDSNIDERDRVRQRSVMDNFIDVRLPLGDIGENGKVVIRAISPGVVIDKVGILN